MTWLGRVFSILLVTLLALSSLIMVESASAQTIPKPSVPDFTLDLSGVSLVKITIRNQAVVLNLDNVINQSLYYNVRVREHTSDKWIEVYTNLDYYDVNMKGTIPIQSDSQYTVLEYPIWYPQGTELDFQVMAMYGVYLLSKPASHSPFVPDFTYFGVAADGQSVWSPTQTITIPNSASPSPTESNLGPASAPTPNIGELAITLASIAVVISVVCVITVLLYVRHLKRSITKT